MPLSFQPACMPVAPACLPHTSPVYATDLLMQGQPAVVTWPRLPLRTFSEQSHVQSVLAFPGLVIDAIAERTYVQPAASERGLDRLALAYLHNEPEVGAWYPDDAPGLAELLKRRSHLKCRAVKGQLLGPISLALHLTNERQQPLAYEPALLDALVQFLALRAAWQVDQLAHLAPDVILCLEEPFLDAFRSPFCPFDWDFGVDLLEQVFAGIHSCRCLQIYGLVNIRALLETSVEMIILDVYTYSDELVAAADGLPAFFARGGVLGWGIVPADAAALARENVDTLAQRVAAVLERLATAGVNPATALRAALITTSEGLATLEPSEAEQALQLCAALSERLRTDYQLSTA